MAFIYYQLIETSINTESLLRTEQLASNTRRAVTFFLEERLAALKFTINEVGYEQLTRSGVLSEVLRNLKLGFGGLTDLSVMTDTGAQVAYAGPFNLEGKNYSDQPWFMECQQHNACVSEIFSGYRGVPHIVVAVKSCAGRPVLCAAGHHGDGAADTGPIFFQDRGTCGYFSGQPRGPAADPFTVLRGGIPSCGMPPAGLFRSDGGRKSRRIGTANPSL
jgi:hypothetical protein